MIYIVKIRTSINGERVSRGQRIELTPDDQVNSLVEEGFLVPDVETKNAPSGRGKRPRKDKQN